MYEEGLSWKVFVQEHLVRVEGCSSLEMKNPALRWPCSSWPSIAQGPSLRMIETYISE